jgi:hypothetical protein
MGYITLSAITGCVEPASGGTAPHIYEQKYNLDIISTYYKKDISKNSNNGWVDYYCVVIVFGNYTQQFKFLNSTDRDNFYNTLP